MFSDMKDQPNNISFTYAALVAVVLIYIAVRAICWHNVVLLEDLDSIKHLKYIQAVKSINLERIGALDADFTPFYPMVSAVLSPFGDGVEFGARLSSFLFSILLFLSLFGIGKYLGTRSQGIVIALLVVAITPEFIGLSYSVLTEPTYIGTVYLGLWIFFNEHHHPSKLKVAVLGFVFGLAFINRTEGIIYLVVIPVMKFFFDVVSRKTVYPSKQLVSWIILFLTGFLALAAPQVWNVSKKMDRIALSGRQIHQAILNSDIGDTEAEKMFGLSFSPVVTNIMYVYQNTSILDELTADGIFSLKRSIKKVHNFISVLVPKFMGVFGITFLAFGIFSLLEKKKIAILGILMIFVCSGILPVVLTPQATLRIEIRHLIVIFPILYLIAGEGFMYFAGRVMNIFSLHRLTSFTALIMLLGLWVGVEAITIIRLVNPPSQNAEYSPIEIVAPIAEMSRSMKKHGISDALIAAQREYFAYYAKVRHIYLPYTDYQGLTHFLKKNQVDYLYIKESRIKNYPFAEVFRKQEYSDELQLIYKGDGSNDDSILLFKITQANK